MTSVTVKTGPDKTEYYASMPFDPTGITLEVTYSDKKTEEVTSGFECTGFSSSTAGVKTVTVSYEDMEAGTVYVTVKPKVLIQDSGTAGFAGHNLVKQDLLCKGYQPGRKLGQRNLSKGYAVRGTGLRIQTGQGEYQRFLHFKGSDLFLGRVRRPGLHCDGRA